MGSCGWLWVVVDGWGWLQMVVASCGWLWLVVVGGCGWLWVVAYFSIACSKKRVIFLGRFSPYEILEVGTKSLISQFSKLLFK